MCGLAGIFHDDPECRDGMLLIRRMTNAIAHRGPDGEGFHLDNGISLGHRRLAIIDPAGGQQPMYNEDNSVGIVFNGEIYNFEELRTELAALGHVFRNRCDTEAIVHAWESWGPDCVHRLSGMFAFAIWDSHKRQLFCARDRLGKKPFYYAQVSGPGGGSLIFGSEMQALAAFPGLERRIDPRAVEDFFALGYVPDPGTIFTGIHKLPAAHTMLVERRDGRPGPARITLQRYWSPPVRTQPCTAEAAKPVLLQKLRAAVSARLVSDVPLGAFLSGGVDSSAVVALASGLRNTPLDTFTIGFDGAEDETPYANEVAERYGTRQHNEHAAATDMIDGARIQAKVFGEPFGDSSSVPTLTVCKLARLHATVAISGDGGDEVFGGYRRTRWHGLVSAARRYLPRPVRRTAIAGLAALYPKLDRAPRFLRAKHTLTELSLEDAQSYARTVTRSHAAQRHALFSNQLRSDIKGHDPFARIADVMEAAEDADPVLQAQLADLATWLPGDILTKVDRASMAASLEVRAPFLDHDLLSWGLSLPSELKIRGAEGKFILKQALEPLLPRDILYRTKQGFTTDMAPLFRRDADRVRARLLGGHMQDSGLFDERGIATLIDNHASGRFDNTQPLWLLLAFEGFLADLGDAAANV